MLKEVCKLKEEIIARTVKRYKSLPESKQIYVLGLMEGMMLDRKESLEKNSEKTSKETFI